MTSHSWDLPKDSLSREALTGLDRVAFKARVDADLDSIQEVLADSESDGTVSRRVAALQALAAARQRTGDFEGSRRATMQAVGFAEGTTDERLIGAVYLSAGIAAVRMGDKSEAINAFSEALAHAERARDSSLISLTLTQLAAIDIAAHNLDNALSLLDRAFALGRQENLTAVKGYALATVGCAYVFGRRDDDAVAILNRAQLLHERARDVASLGRTYNNFGVLHYINGRFVNAIPYFERALDLLEDVSDAVTLLGVLNNNVRAFELQYLERAGHFREKMEDFSGILSDPDLPRFDDLTALAISSIEQEQDATFASSLFVDGPVVFFPTPPPSDIIGLG